MNDVLPDLNKWIDRGDRIALATVVAVKKSAPRPPGAKMAVNEDGEIIGAVSGGCVEGAVVEIADEVLRGAPPRLVHFGIADAEAWDVGLPCGGEIDVWIQEYEPGRFTEIANAGGRAAEVTLLEGDEAGAKVLFEEDGTQSGTLGVAGARRRRRASRRRTCCGPRRPSSRGRLFVDVIAPAPRLIMFGAVPIAAALCTLSRAAGWRPFVVDPRTRFATQERFPDAERGVRSVARRGVRAARWDRSGDLDRGPDPRPEARRRGADDRTALAGTVHRRDGVAAGTGVAPRAAARRRARRGRAGADVGPGRARSGRARAPRRRRCRSSPRWSRPGTDATAGGCRRPRGGSTRSPLEPIMTGGLVLAAGAGVRFGGDQSKLLALVDGRPVLEWAVRAQCSVASLERVVVVVGSRADEVLAAVDFGRAEPVVCPDWDRGQSASLRCGLQALAGASKVVVTLGDQPLVTPAVVELFAAADGGTRAVYDGRPGHPVVLGPDEILALTSLSGDRGARDLLRGGPTIEVGHLCSGRDVDTPDDLEAIRDEARTVI